MDPMSSELSDAVPLSDRFAQLERAFIDEFLRLQGYDYVTLNTLSDVQRHAMLTSASTYAATKLAEIESRAHYIHDIHGTAQKRRD
jgi:hypothetical protein